MDPITKSARGFAKIGIAKISDYLIKTVPCYNSVSGNIQGKHSTKKFSRKKVRKKHPYIKKYIENAIPYKEPVGGINLAYV